MPDKYRLFSKKVFNQKNKMMKKGLLAGVITLVLTVILFSACSKVPQAEIDSANAAVEAAKTAGAEMYAEQEFLALQDSLKSVMDNIKAADAKEKLIAVTQLAQEVAQKSETKKEELKSMIQTTLNDVKTLIQTNTQLITDAAKIKNSASQVEGIKNELKTVESTITEVNAMFEKGEYIATADKAKAAKDKAADLNKKLEEIIKGKTKTKKA